MILLQGISSCIRNCRGCGHKLVWRYSYPIYSLPARDFISAGTAGTGEGRVGESSNSGAAVENILAGPLVDQAFTATHYADDGRRFEFATVIVKAMNKGRSPLNIWQHACSLIGARSPPTFGVAFVSKPTESAKQAIQDFAEQLAGNNKPLVASGLQFDSRQRPLEAGPVEISSVSVPRDAINSLSIPCKFRGSGAAGVTGENSYGQNADVPPLIGCVMDDMGDFNSSEAGQGVNSFSQTQTGSTPNVSVTGARREPAFGFHRTFFDDDDDEDEGTLSDWESVCSEYVEEVATGNVKLSVKESDEQEGEELTSESSNLIYEEEVSKEGLVSFLNALTKPSESLSEETGVSENVYSLESSESKAIQNRKANEGTVPRSLLVPELGHHQLRVCDSGADGLARGGVVSAVGGLRRDGGEVSPIEIWTGSAKSTVRKDSGVDEDYKLVLCVGHMPGAKAFAFHSSTTGLPRLPDLENAVTVNNPHMLLFGAPGFVFPDFIQRLSSVFPSSCRAGAFLAPLYTSQKSQWTKVSENTCSPLFFGSRFSTTGVVGLAISAKGNGEEVPADAFAELVRMSVAMPRIPGFVFLDEPVSTKLFLPKNVATQRFSLSSRASLLGHSTLILDQLSKKLLKENTVPVVQKVVSVTEKVTYSDEDTIEVVGSSKGSAGHISGSREDARTLDRLPLALFDAVLFPGLSLPFYIFEPCYRAMVRHCVEEGKPFGLSAMYNASWTTDGDQCGELIGTVANLKVHSFERDCRSYIIAHGLRRFRVPNEGIWAEPGSFGLTMGQVQFFDDRECETTKEKEELDELAKRAVALCLEVTPEGVLAPALLNSVADPIVASFAVGHIIDVPTRVKRRWLKLVDTKTRLLEQIAFLETKASSVSSG